MAAAKSRWSWRRGGRVDEVHVARQLASWESSRDKVPAAGGDRRGSVSRACARPREPRLNLLAEPVVGLRWHVVLGLTGVAWLRGSQHTSTYYPDHLIDIAARASLDPVGDP